MKAAGKPLGQLMKGKIYLGIKTGLNDAFVIDASIRAALVQEDAASSDIIKPYVRGKHVEKWLSQKPTEFIIYAPQGITISAYPAIKKHLSQFKADLERRALDQKWYELQQAQQAYAQGFEATKLVFPDISESVQFAFDPSGGYLDMTAFCLPTGDLYLLGVLNSVAVNHFFTLLGAQVRGGYLRFKRQYVEQIPIPEASAAERTAVAGLVERVLAEKRTDPQADVAALEQAIDAHVYRLYGLTKDEIKLVENRR